MDDLNFMEELDKKTTGERIKTARKAIGLTQAELARKIGVTQPTVAQWERGGYMPQYSNLQAISQVTNVALYFLCDSKTWETISAKAALSNELTTDTIDKEYYLAQAVKFWKQRDYVDDQVEEVYSLVVENPKVFAALLKLNSVGKAALNQYAEDLTYNPKYTKEEG